jgi:MFS transporter, FSR family, fosmidomycin resistance protein
LGLFFAPKSLRELLRPDETTLMRSAADIATRTIHDTQRRTLWSACAAHILHDGYTDLIYILLPVWQSEFGIGFGALALLRGLYAGSMAGLQVPVGRLSNWVSGRTILTVGMVLAAVGYGLAGFSTGMVGLCAALTLSGCGSSTQHPIASAAISHAYGKEARRPLSIYNFSGDLGKAAIPASASLLITFMTWRQALWIISAVGMIGALGLSIFVPTVVRGSAKNPIATEKKESGRSGFTLLFMIGVLDTGVRMGLLLFLPFLLKGKGASLATIGASLSLVFIGGAAGKFVCGWLGARLGVIGTVLITEGGTAIGIFAVLLAPLTLCLFLLPLLGLMLNGTSSVLYGTVPDLTPPHRTERAFALFYTGTIGSGAVAPIIYGVLGDAIGTVGATMATAVTALLILPLALALAPHLLKVPRLKP